MKRFLLLMFLGFLFLPSAAEPRVYLDISAPQFVQIPIALPRWASVDRTPPALTAKVYETLSNDLAISGFFRVIDAQHLPQELRKREGIPSTLVLSEWVQSGGEILLAGDCELRADGLTLRLRFHLFDLVEQKHLIGKQYESHLQNLRNMVHRISDEVILQLTGEKGVNNTKIAYSMVQGEGKEIFIADFDGANPKQITKNSSINIRPVWAPDGKRIFFTSYLKRNPDLYVIDTDGKNLQRFSSFPGINASPSFSPDGKKMALMLTIEGKTEIAVVDQYGKNPKILTKSHGNESSPTWSPDGNWIAFVSDRSGSPQIYIMSVHGDKVRRLTYEGNYNTNPSWSPKGDRIAYCGRVGGQFQIFTIAPDGSGLEKLTSSAGSNESPYWSPDGRYIAFSSTRTGASKIFVMNANGSNQRPLTVAKGGESSPAWSPRLE